MVCIAVGLTSMLDIAAMFDMYVSNNLSRLITYSSFLIVVNLSITASINAVGKPEDRPFVQKMWFLLFIILVVVGIIYIFFISKLPEFSYYETPQSLPETIFKIIIHYFEAIQAMLVFRIYWAYLPIEKSATTRVRVIMLIACSLVLTGCSLVVVLTALGYFLPILASPILPNLIAILAAAAIALELIVFVNNKIYIAVVVISRSFQQWYAFQDLQYLIERMTKIFPVIGLVPDHPNFFRFIQDPERYLYPTIILILDGRAMLNDFLTEVGDPPPDLELWETEEGNDLVGEALEIQWAMPLVLPPDDFYAMIEAYRQTSRTLFINHRKRNEIGAI